MSGTAKASEHWRGGVGEVGQAGVTELSSGYKVILSLKCLKSKFRYLLIRFIITIIDGKYKIS